MRAILAGILTLIASRALAADCVWKDEMSVAEITACRDAGAEPPNAPAPSAKEQALLAESAQRQREENQRWIQRQRDAARPKAPVVGMSAADAMALPFPWGKPAKVNKTTTARGIQEQWVYTDIQGSPIRYLYFVNGALTTIQE